QARPQAGGSAGGRRILRPRRPGAAQVPAAAERRPARDLRDELPQAGRRRRGGSARMAHARAAHRPAEARRGDGRAGARVPERDRVPAGRPARADARRASALHAHDPGALRPGHRRVARRGAGEDPLLERVQSSRSLVGGASALLAPRRVAAFVALSAAIGVYYATHESWFSLDLWPAIGWLSLVVIPAVFGLVWLALPAWSLPLRQLLVTALAFGVLAVVLQWTGASPVANFAKLGAMTFVAWCF